jgi:hypothetical protein
MMRVKLPIAAFFILVCLFCQPADAAKVYRTPDVGSAGYDHDANGIQNDGAYPGAWVQDGSNYRIETNSCAWISPVESFADATASGGTALRKPLGSDQNAAPIQCPPIPVAGDFHLWFLALTPSPSANLIWPQTTRPVINLNNAVATALFNNGFSPQWGWTNAWNGVSFGAGGAQKTNGTGRPTVNSAGTAPLWITKDPGVGLDVIVACVVADCNPALVGSGGGAPLVAYEAMKADTVPPASCADMVNANQFPAFGGLGSDSGAFVTAQLVWGDAATDKIYGCIKRNDTDLAATTTSNDSFGINNDDGFILFYTANQNAVSDSTTKGIAINIAATPAEFDQQDPINTGDTSYNANCSVTRTLVGTLNDGATDTSWQLFFICDRGFNAAADVITLFNASLTNRTTAGVVSGKRLFGDLFNMSDWKGIKWSSTVLPGGAPSDTTAPVLTSCSIPAGNIGQVSADILCTTDEAGSAIAQRDTDNDNATSGADMVQVGPISASVGAFTINMSGLTAGTAYEARACVTDASGNQGCGAVQDFTTLNTTPDLTGTHFVKPAATGSGNCSSFANACAPPNYWLASTGAHRNVVAGDVIIYDDGDYVGSAAVIDTASIAGTASNPITIKARNDGKVFLNGNLQVPKIFAGNGQWFIIDGFDACCGYETVLRWGMRNTTIRRVASFDAGGPGSVENIVYDGGGSDNLYEDIVGFGRGRKIWNPQGENRSIVRRGFFLYNKVTAGCNSPNSAVSDWYHSYDVKYENTIATNNEQNGVNCNTAWVWDGQGGISGGNETTEVSRWASRTRHIGGIGFARCQDRSWFGMFANFTSTDTIYDGVVAYIEPGVGCWNENENYKRAFELNGFNNPALSHYWGAPPVNLQLRNSVGVATKGNAIHSAYQQSNNYLGTTLSAALGAYTVWTAPGVKVCKRVVNGVETSTGLWNAAGKWPMNARIIAAMARTSHPSYDLTSIMESLFGPIPAQCK